MWSTKALKNDTDMIIFYNNSLKQCIFSILNKINGAMKDFLSFKVEYM